MRGVSFVLAILIASGCSSGGDRVTSPDPGVKQAGIPVTNPISHVRACYDPTDPACLHTPPADPFPNAPGYYLGDSYSWVACQGGNDGDHDGFDDGCEYQIALAFRPLLSTNPYDLNVDRQPHWAARPDANLKLKVMYLESYAMDDGGRGSGHFGDSEFVILDIQFDPYTQHWKLVGGFLTAHYRTSLDASMGIGNGFPVQFEFPDRVLGYPRIYVSRDKHANYVTRQICGTGLVGTETCAENYDTARLDVLNYRNVGSHMVHLVDYEPSQDPRYGGFEYYWTYDGSSQDRINTWFCGWDLTSAYANRNHCASAYGFLLERAGF